ncbi:hypothetical protein ACET3Z_019801 [Daucus carota]
MRISMDECSSSQPTRPRWADEDDNDGDDLILPPRQVIGPDDDGIKKVIEHKLNDENKLVRITTTTRVRKVADARLSTRGVERRAWRKFGHAVSEEAAGAKLTVVSTEDILLERPLPYGSKREESKPQIEKEGTTLMICRSCGRKGNHWTAMCPYKELPQPIESFSEQDVTSAKDGTKGTYVPPSLRRGAERSSGSDMKRRTEENSVRVTNLSEDTREADLNELCSAFGPVTRAYVATDHSTGMCRGFGFVNFLNREDAEKAIKVLNGYGYDNLILQVEWAAPRTNQI